MIAPVSAAQPPASTAPAAGVAPAGTTAVDPKVVEAAQGFEGIFMSMLVDEMFKGTEIASAQPVYGGLMTQAFGDALSDAGGVGLAAMLVRQMGGEA